MDRKPDFGGWATRNNLKCSDGRTIRKNAFAEDDGRKVPLVWNHDHTEPDSVLGHALLENREEGVYTYGFFNDTKNGLKAKALVNHGDIDSLSIYANHLKQHNGDVFHGEIKEVSLVYAGANPGAYIDTIMQHSEDGETEGDIYTGETIELFVDEVEHSDENSDAENVLAEEIEHAESEKTVKDVFDSFNEEQKNVVYFLIDQALKEKENNKEETMQHNVFDNEEKENTLTHSDIEAIFSDAKKYGSLRDSVLMHTQEYGIENIDILFPDAKAVTSQPELIKRRTEWVSDFFGGVTHTPFSRIKSMAADITADAARAKGYTKGNLKLEEVFSLLKRETTPTTIYKKQKLDRDDLIDITNFDVVAFMKGEMRIMWEEEVARAAFIGDGRSSGESDKISETNIRPIWTDSPLYTVQSVYEYSDTDTDEEKAKKFIRTVIKSRKNYRGSGNLTCYTTDDILTSCLLLEDSTGRVIYETVEKLATALRVKKIVTVPVMEGQHRTPSSGTYSGRRLDLVAILVNPKDYTIGADKGGQLNMFDDFDLDYNQMKYLLEGRCSGALTKPYSAIVIEETAELGE